MDSLKLHQLLNYYPTIFMVIGSLILAGGLALGSEKAKRLALRIICAVALLTILVVFAGEFASWDEALYSGTRGAALDAHKIMGTAAFASVEAAGIAALVALLRSRGEREKGKAAAVISFILTVAAAVLLIATIFKGRHVKWAELTPDFYRSETEMRG